MDVTFPNIENDQLPRDIYHYTDAWGLEGILGAKALWGTHASFLNDSQEIIFGLEILRKAAEDLGKDVPRDVIDAFQINDSRLPPIIRSALRAILPIAFAKKMPELIDSLRDSLVSQYGPFVACLSTERDLLSQWRGYSNGGGFAIRFDGTELQESMVRCSRRVEQETGCDEGAGRMPLGALRFAQIIYSDDGKTDYARQQIQGFLADMGRVISMVSTRDGAAPDANDFDDAQDVASWMHSMPMRLKDWGFREEKEYRVITFSAPKRFTPTKGSLIPRIDIIFEPHCVKEVLVGPGDNSEMRKSSILYYKMTNEEYSHIDVNMSKIPFRGN